MEKLKSLDEINLPDSRHNGFVKHVEGKSIPITLEDHYNETSQIKLSGKVPEDIRSHFETSKNIYLYGWYVYSFYASAIFLAFVTLEMALKLRFESKESFKKLIKKAVGKGLIKEDNFAHIKKLKEKQSKESMLTNEYYPSSTIDYCKVLEDSIPWLRNSFAHPEINTILTPAMALYSIEISAEFINQLF